MDTDRQMQTDFIICPLLYAIAMGQITNKKRHVIGAITDDVTFKVTGI